MKILLIPLDSYKEGIHQDLFNAFNKYYDNVLLHCDLVSSINFEPDVIFYQGGLPMAELVELKHHCKKFVVWTGDLKYAPSKYLMELRTIADVYLFPFNGKLLERYAAILGKRCEYLFEYFQDSKFREYKEMESGKIVFVGNYYSHLPEGNERLELQNFIEGIESYGSGMKNGEIKNTDVPDLYNDSYIVIAHNNMHDVEGYFTPRNLTAMASGSCCVMKHFPNIDFYFKDWVDCIVYKNKFELLDIIEFLKNNPEVRNRIAKKGRESVERYYSLSKFVSEFRKIIK